MKKMMIVSLMALLTLGCYASGPLRVTDVEVFPINCEESNTATLNTIAVGGQPPYLFEAFDEISNNLIGSNNTGMFTGITVSVVRMIITDANNDITGFFVDTGSNKPFTRVTWTIQHPTCPDVLDGVITIVQESLEPGTFDYINCFADQISETGVFTGLGVANSAGGLHCIEVLTRGQCTPNDPVFEAVTLVIQLVNSGLLATASSTPATCGEPNGTITVTSTTGGEIPYQYALNDGMFQASPEFKDLTAGPYTVSVVDANMCTTEIMVEVGQVGDIICGDPIVTPVPCDRKTGGSITLHLDEVMGDAPPYEYSIGEEFIPVGQTFAPLTAGCYYMTVRDVNGCECAPKKVKVPQIRQVKIYKICPTKATKPCFNDGSICVRAKGFGPLLYSLNNGPFQTEPFFDNLTPGKYKVVVAQEADKRGLCDAICYVTVKKKKKSHCK